MVVFHGPPDVPDGGAKEALHPGTVELRANIVALQADREHLVSPPWQSCARLDPDSSLCVYELHRCRLPEM